MGTAVLYDVPDILKLLKDSKIPIKDDAFTLAVGMNKQKTANWLAANGCFVNHVEKDGTTPLILAICNNSTEQLEYILNKLEEYKIPVSDAIPNQSDFLTLVAKKDSDIFQKMRPYFDETKINDRDTKGQTPLHAAAEAGKTTTMRRLVAMGADLEVKNAEGETPVISAICANKIETVVCMLKMGAELRSCKNLMIAAAKNNGAGLISLLAKYRQPLNLRDEHGNTALHYAVLKNHYEAVEMLAEMGAKTGAKNLKGQTPRDLARIKGDVELLSILGQDKHKKAQRAAQP